MIDAEEFQCHEPDMGPSIPGPFIAAFISLACSLYGITAMWQFKSMQMSGFVDAGEEIVIEEEITDSGITFFMTFVLPLLLDDVETLRGFIILPVF